MFRHSPLAVCFSSIIKNDTWPPHTISQPQFQFTPASSIAELFFLAQQPFVFAHLQDG